MMMGVQRMYDFSMDVNAEVERVKAQSARFREMIVDGVHYVNRALADGKSLIAEGANAIMLDVDYGTFPYVTSSSTGAGGIWCVHQSVERLSRGLMSVFVSSTGLGIAPSKVSSVLGVFKAYTTRVGGGPFPTELTDARGGGMRPMHAPETNIGLHMQTVGAEIGVTYVSHGTAARFG